MSDSTTQKIEGANLLSSLAQLFFKSLDNALSSDSEYTDEDGVVKQVNTIKLADADGKEYKLTIKLSPIKDREDLYYVEAETDAPKLNLNAINKKSLQLNSDNIKKFKQLIDKLISDGKYSVQGDTDKADDSKEDAEDKLISELIASAEDWFERKAVVAKTPDGETIELSPHLEKTDDIYIYDLIIDVEDENGTVIDHEDLPDSSMPLKDKSNKILGERKFLSQLNDRINEFSELNDYTDVHRVIRSSTIVQATFIKDTEGVGLVAVKASNNIDKTMTMIYDIMDSDEFIDSIEEGKESSFTIADADDEYDINPVDNIDCSQCYADIYKLVSKFYITLKSVQSMIGLKIWRNDNFFNDVLSVTTELQTKVAVWASDKSDIIPILQDPFSMIPDFQSFRDYSSNEEIPEIKESIKEECNKLIELISFLEVSLKAEDQSDIDLLLNKLRSLVA